MSYTLNNIVRGLNPNDAVKYVTSYLRELLNYDLDDYFNIYDIYNISELDNENMYKLAFSVFSINVDDSERLYYAYFYVSLFLYMMAEFDKNSIDYILTQVNLRAISEKFVNREEVNQFDYQIFELVSDFFRGSVMGVIPSDEVFTDFVKTAVDSGSYSVFVPDSAKQEFISLVNSWKEVLASAVYGVSKFIMGYIYNYDFVGNSTYHLLEVLDNNLIEEGIHSLDIEKEDEYLYDFYLISQNQDINSISRKDKKYEFCEMMENGIREILRTKYNLIGV